MIVFKNKGLLDIRAVQTLGVSVKKEGAIGYFGTGLKYAICVLLREKQTIKIYIGTECFEFESRTENIGGKDFEIVFMNGQQLSFTTEFGKNWDVWMAFREIASNCKDENGEFFHSTETPDLVDSETTIVVQGEKFEEAYREKDSIFWPHEKQPEKQICEIIKKDASFFYYRGVRVMAHQTHTVFTYNVLKELRLTEDRTVYSEHDAKYAVVQYFLLEADESEIHDAVTAPDMTFEGELDFDQLMSPSQAFMNVMERLIKNHKACNKSAKDLYKRLTKKEETWEPAVLSKVQEKQMEKAIIFLKKFEPDVEEFPIMVCESIRENVLGMADRKKNQIYLSKIVFAQGTKQVATTMLEEFYHLKHGYSDRTYSFQNFLFDKIITLAEEAAGEPI